MLRSLPLADRRHRARLRERTSKATPTYAADLPEGTPACGNGVGCPETSVYDSPEEDATTPPTLYRCHHRRRDPYRRLPSLGRCRDQRGRHRLKGRRDRDPTPVCKEPTKTPVYETPAVEEPVYTPKETPAYIPKETAVMNQRGRRDRRGGA